MRLRKSLTNEVIMKKRACYIVINSTTSETFDARHEAKLSNPPETARKGVNFLRNCGAASGGEYHDRVI